VESAWRESKALEGREGAPNGFVRGSKSARLLDERCQPTDSVSPALTALNYRLYNTTPYERSYYFVQSMVHMLASYDHILGLTGSLGSPAEREYLTRTFGAAFAEVPSFLDTCRNSCKRAPALVDDMVRVHKTPEAQLTEVLSQAASKRASVPVVVIAKNAQQAAEVHAALQRRLPPDATQLFLQVKPDGSNMDWGAIMERSTQAIEVAAVLRLQAADEGGAPEGAEAVGVAGDRQAIEEGVDHHQLAIGSDGHVVDVAIRGGDPLERHIEPVVAIEQLAGAQLVLEVPDLEESAHPEAIAIEAGAEAHATVEGALEDRQLTAWIEAKAEEFADLISGEG
jgi:hypothetical protein